MSAENDASSPDFRNGFALRDLPDGGSVSGRVDTEDAILVRQGDRLFAVGAHCTHYHGPLAEGWSSATRCAVRGITPASASAPAKRCVRRRSIRSRAGASNGSATRLTSGKSWRLPRSRRPSPSGARPMPESIVIVGGGGAGLAAAEMLRRPGYDGSLTMLSADEAAPSDRPNLSKDFLAGTAQDDWIPLRSS